MLGIKTVENCRDHSQKISLQLLRVSLLRTELPRTELKIELLITYPLRTELLIAKILKRKKYKFITF